MDGGGICSAVKDVAPLSGGPLLTLESELVSAESGFPHCPRLVGAGEAVSVGELLGESARSEERAGGDGGEPFIRLWAR